MKQNESYEKTIVRKLLKRAITPSEAIYALNLNSDEELEKVMLNAPVKKLKIEFIITDIKLMNYLEIKEYKNQIKKRGVNIKDIIKLVESLWEDGTFSGFDYRYFVESIGMKPSKEFINRAKSTGRYDD